MKKFNYFEKKYLLMKKEDDNHKLSNNNCIREHLSKSISLLKELVCIEKFINLIDKNHHCFPSDCAFELLNDVFVTCEYIPNQLFDLVQNDTYTDDLSANIILNRKFLFNEISNVNPPVNSSNNLEGKAILTFFNNAKANGQYEIDCALVYKKLMARYSIKDIKFVYKELYEIIDEINQVRDMLEIQKKNYPKI